MDRLYASTYVRDNSDDSHDVMGALRHGRTARTLLRSADSSLQSAGASAAPVHEPATAQDQDCDCDRKDCDGEEPRNAELPCSVSPESLQRKKKQERHAQRDCRSRSSASKLRSVLASTPASSVSRFQKKGLN